MTFLTNVLESVIGIWWAIFVNAGYAIVIFGIPILLILLLKKKYRKAALIGLGFSLLFVALWFLLVGTWLERM